MSFLGLNDFYRAFLWAGKIKNIYRNQFKYNNYRMKILYLLSFLLLLFSVILLANARFDNFLLFLSIYIAAVFLFVSIDRKSLKIAVKALCKKHKVKFVFPDLLDQLKYYLWKEKLDKVYSLSSIKRSLEYLEIELSKYSIERNNYHPIYITIFSAITIAAFWKLTDELKFSHDAKIIIYSFICYVSYRFIAFKFFIFEDKQKKLSMLKRFLSWLKFERSNQHLCNNA